MKARIVISQTYQQSVSTGTGKNLVKSKQDLTTTVPIEVHFNKHNRDKALGTLCNEVLRAIKALAEVKSNGRIRSGKQLRVQLQMADMKLDTANLPKKNVTVFKALAAELKVTPNNANSEQTFFKNLKVLINYMAEDVVFMTFDEFLTMLWLRAEEQRIARAEVKAAKEAKQVTA